MATDYAIVRFFSSYILFMRWVIVIILLHEYNHLNLNKLVWIFYNNTVTYILKTSDVRIVCLWLICGRKVHPIH